ncbi:MAG TPA: efflux RND transporter permease subunit, partial [Longimicrobiales bacterium]|nr:efflux RND transporter permease subunit [Longimicrobiales bacterium]
MSDERRGDGTGGGPGRDSAGTSTPDDQGLTPMARHVGAGGPPDDPSLLDRFKEFWATSFAVEHRTAIVVLFILISLGGIVAYRAIPKESFPEIEIPMVAVSTVYPGVSPEDIETLITRPLEEELNTISDLTELTSTSVEGYSSIIAEFDTDVDLNEALQKVREKVDLAKPELPEEAEEPQVVEFNLQEFPILQVNLSGEYGLVRLKEIGEELQDRLEGIPSILRVDLRGGLEREVQVDV